LANLRASVTRLAPLNLRRSITRPVSYYALFECVAASKPTSWLSGQRYILLHLACIWDLSCGSGLFPFWQRNLSHAVWLPYSTFRHSEFDGGR